LNNNSLTQESNSFFLHQILFIHHGRSLKKILAPRATLSLVRPLDTHLSYDRTGPLKTSCLLCTNPEHWLIEYIQLRPHACHA